MLQDGASMVRTFILKNKSYLKNHKEGRIHSNNLVDIFEVAIKPRWVLNDKYNPQTKRAKPGWINSAKSKEGEVAERGGEAMIWLDSIGG